MKELVIEVFALSCAASVLAQGTVLFNNHISGIVVSKVYLPNYSSPVYQVGNGPNDTPPGTTDWTGWEAVSGSGFTAQLWAAEGYNQPESALQQATPTTIFRTGPAAGFVAPTMATLIGVRPGASATITMRVWDNAGGTITSWDQALAANVTRGQSPLFGVGNIGGGIIQPAALAGLQSFALSGICLGPYFEGWLTQPTNQVVVQGGTATFYAAALVCPPSYRWYHNGVQVGANAPWYRITNAQLADAGSYWAEVFVFNCCGVTNLTSDSAVATLTVLTGPVITSQPQSQTAEAGSSVRFLVHADGSSPLTYTWFFNGTNALTLSTTEGTLVLTNVQPNQAEAYTVAVTNIIGVVTSAPALLSVIPTVPRTAVPALLLTGQPGTLLNLDFAGALTPVPDWVPLAIVQLTNAAQWYVDLSSPPASQRFYRAWQNSVSSVVPALNAGLVQAISLNGVIGDRVRIDAINQFGATDAWVTLGTVTLTNTSQLYFDTSAIGQPPRLWRLVPVP
jgi:hypothetical protein